MSYVGRFAPSPTGPLHMGSLIAATASYLQARTQQGKWLVRIEDLDPPREVKGAAEDIIRTLAHFGFEWDDEIRYQSQRIDIYQMAIQQLFEHGKAYACACSRTDIQHSGRSTAYGLVYPGTCRQGIAPGKQARSIRLRVPDKALSFQDRIQGHCQQNLLRDIGDFVIRRADGQIAYQLAVVIDDAEQQVSEVVRGCDLLDSTTRQIYLQQQLGLPTPDYAHIPVLVNRDGEKLSKQTGAAAIQAQAPAAALAQALCYLGQDVPTNLFGASTSDIWSWALDHWNMDNVRTGRSIGIQAR